MNKTADYDLTIIVPAYDEEDNIDALEKRLGAFLPKSALKTCLLFVNDGSKDNTLQRLKEICGRNKDFHYISFERNCGLSAAIKAGIDECESEYVGYIDADLQTDPEDFNLLIPGLKDHELVMGIRANRRDSAFKKLQSKIANGFRRSMTGDGVQDTGCPLKIIKTANAKRIPMFTGMHRFLPALIQLQEGRVLQVPVRHYPRTAGVSKYHLWNRLAGPFMDCFGFRWMRKRWYNYHIASSDL